MHIMRKNTPRLPYLVLSPTEEAVVRALTKRPALSISRLGNEIGLARTSIYAAVRSLTKKHIVIRDEFLYSLQTSLREKAVPTVPTAQDQIDALMKEMLGLDSGEIIRSIESDEEIRELFKDSDAFLHWQKIVTKRKIVLKGIGTKNALRMIQTLAPAEAIRHIRKRSGAARVTTENISGACVLISFRQSTIFFSRKRQIFYRINDAGTAHFTQSIIDMLYSHLEYQKIA